LLLIFVVNSLLVNDKIINLKSNMITYLCLVLGPSIISLLMRLSAAFLASALGLVIINWEL